MERGEGGEGRGWRGERMERGEGREGRGWGGERGEGRGERGMSSTKLSSVKCLSSHISTSPPHLSPSLTPSHQPSGRGTSSSLSNGNGMCCISPSFFQPGPWGGVGGREGGRSDEEEGGLLKVCRLTWIKAAECVSASFTVRSRLEANTLVGSWPHVVTRTRL